MDTWDENLVLDYMLVLYEKLHIRTYDQQNFPSDHPPGPHFHLQSGGARTTPGDGSRVSHTAYQKLH